MSDLRFSITSSDSEEEKQDEIENTDNNTHLERVEETQPSDLIEVCKENIILYFNIIQINLKK